MEKQKLFLEALGEIQKTVVELTACKESTYKSKEAMLYDATYEVIYGIMELVDGYRKADIKLDIVDRDTRKSLREGIELHDACVEYLRYEE